MIVTLALIFAALTPPVLIALLVVGLCMVAKDADEALQAELEELHELPAYEPSHSREAR